MEYTVQKLAALAGVSARTLRYYDQIGLLRPARIASSGYRIYGRREVDRLQQILFYREMGAPLDLIGELLDRPTDRLAALREHHRRLLAERDRIDRLLLNAARSIASEERGIPMQDKDKFEGFKRALIEKNEAQYGGEIRQRYGDKTVDESNQKLLNLTPEEYGDMEAAGAEVLRLLDVAFAEGDPAGPAGLALAEAHRDWLGFTWQHYSSEAHAGLAELYVADPRFAAYYDRGVPGKAAFLRDAIRAHC